MRHAPNLKAEKFRVQSGKLGSSQSDGNNGVFLVTVKAADLLCVVSDRHGWDHILVSLAYRYPTWEEMQAVKELFFKDAEAAMQLHLPGTAATADQLYTLHLWRPNDLDVAAVPIPTPPAWMLTGTLPPAEALSCPTK